MLRADWLECGVMYALPVLGSRAEGWAAKWRAAQTPNEGPPMAPQLAIEAVPPADVGLHAEVVLDRALGRQPPMSGHALPHPAPEVTAADQQAGGDDREHEATDDGHLHPRSQPAKPEPDRCADPGCDPPRATNGPLTGCLGRGQTLRPGARDRADQHGVAPIAPLLIARVRVPLPIPIPITAQLDAPLEVATPHMQANHGVIAGLCAGLVAQPTREQLAPRALDLGYQGLEVMGDLSPHTSSARHRPRDLARTIHTHHRRLVLQRRPLRVVDEGVLRRPLRIPRRTCAASPRTWPRLGARREVLTPAGLPRTVAVLPQRRYGLDTPTTRVLAREAAAWHRWIQLLVRGPLAGVSEIADPSVWRAGLVERAWRGAVRETAARVLLAGVREQLLGGHDRGDALQVELDGGTLTLPLRRRGPFGLHWAELERELDPRVEDPLDLIEQIGVRAGLDAATRTRVGTELLDSLVNLAQARVADELRQLLARERDKHPASETADPRFEDPEHFVTDGHPWHPMTRVRLGLSRAAVVRHAPEQLASTWVACVDIDAELMRVAGDWTEESTRWFGAAPQGFVRVPIHPASPPNLRRLFTPLLERGAIRAVERAPLPCRSLLSLRTVALAPTRQLKLACPVHTTSTRRLVSPMSVHNGPQVSRLIADIQRSDPLTATLRLLPEPAAAGLEPDCVGPHAGELGAIVRVTPALGANEHAWVCAAIGERWPGTDELVLERACAGYPGGRVERVTALIDAWINKLVPPALRLFSIYGIALELHAQNTLAHVLDGRLRGIWVRDLGGIRIHTPRLDELSKHQPKVQAPSFAARSFILTDDLDEVRGKLEHTLFHAHLTCLFATAGRLGVDEFECWAKLRRCLADCYARWGSELGMSEPRRRTLAADLEALTRPQVRAKALLRMRLFERSSDYDYTRVDNIVHGPH